jgi:lactoylglutathione lyase
VRGVLTMATARLVGINHVALEVGDVEEALGFYGSLFEFGVVERELGMAFVGMGDQFLALAEGGVADRDRKRHFGLVVDDKPAARAALGQAGVAALPGPRLNFHDPWGNLVQVVDYRDVKFTKAPSVLRGMELEALKKRAAARHELRTAGLL